MAAWTKEETLKLIELWSAEDIQTQLEGCKRNKQVFEKLAAQLRDEGYDRTFQQCREKTKKLRQDYKKVKDKIKQTGEEGRRHLIAKFEYFEVMDAFLANRPATQPKVVIDSLAGQCTSNADSDSDDSVQPAGSTTVGNGNSTAATVDLDSSDEPTVNVKQKPKESADLKPPVDVKPVISSKKKRKRQIEIVQDTMKGVIKQVVEAQKESDQKFVELEEKRMKMEQAQQEREAQMRRDDQEFQMRVYQMMLTGSYSQYSYSPSGYQPHSSNQ